MIKNKLINIISKINNLILIFYYTSFIHKRKLEYINPSCY